MQSVLRANESENQAREATAQNSNEILTEIQKHVSVIPNISQPNQILYRQLKRSKPVSHIFNQNIVNIKFQSGFMHQLYNPNSPSNKATASSPIFSFFSKFSDKQLLSLKNKRKQNKLQNLKEFFLAEPQKIVFLSRNVTLALNEKDQQKFHNLIKLNLDNKMQSPKEYQKYLEALTQISKILSNDEKFPFLCPQLNQNITLNTSLIRKYEQNAQDWLSFNDNFQCANILIAKKIDFLSLTIPTFSICTRFDYQTASYGQWFYFSIKRNSQSQLFSKKEILKQNKPNHSKRFKFVICNMTKRYSMLGTQMKISVCRKGVWGKQGINIRYYESSFRRGNKNLETQNLTTPVKFVNSIRNHQLYYALEFQLELQQNQQILVSYNEPYSFSKLSNFLDTFSKVYDSIEANNSRDEISNIEHQSLSKPSIKNDLLKQHVFEEQVYFKRELICETPLKNQIQCISFSFKKPKINPLLLSQRVKSQTDQSQNKKIIFILARSHPIETAGSFVIEGFIKELFLFIQYKNDQKRKQQLKAYFSIKSKGKLIQNLLKYFVIKIVPMVNPDGVILGNSRCNFFGFDLNRQWKRSNKLFSQQIYALKRFLLRFKERIQMVIDLHGHSKQKNVFAYGLHDFKNPFSTRQFPYILSKLTDKNFLFNQCRFTRLIDLKSQQSNEKKNIRQNSKEGTARIWLFRKLQIPNIFTIENSYCGSIYSNFHYDGNSYAQIGREILLGIGLYFIGYSSKETQNKIKKQRRKKKIKTTTEAKFFEQENHLQMFQTKILTIDQLTKLKEFLMQDMKSKQQNATLGLKQINSSESEDQQRIEDIIFQDQKIPNQKAKNTNKSKSHHMIKKNYDPVTNVHDKVVKVSRYPSNEDQESSPYSPPTYNFRTKYEKGLQNNRRSQMAYQKPLSLQPQIRFNKRYVSLQGRKNPIQLSYESKQSLNHKSTFQLQKNVPLSIIEVGWNQSKLIQQEQSENDRRNNLKFGNFPLINSANSAIFLPRSNLSANLQLKQRFGRRRIQSPQAKQKRQLLKKQSDNTSTTQLMQQTHQIKNVAEFIKKLESNVKLKNQMMTRKKIQKYKQIIMKINGGKQ